jgi:hypothetical protein
LAIGLFGGLVLLHRHGPGLGLFVSNPPPPPPAGQARVVAAAWFDQALAKVKADHEETSSFSDREKLPIPELLKQYRRELEEERAEVNLRLDAIVNASSRYRDHPDPAAAMRTALKNQTDEGTNTALAIFHAWRERDLDAALACLARSWRLLDELYTTSALLEREFGRDWMAQQLRDDKLPYRMRRTIANGLATHFAWDAGLAGFITCYQTITDPELKDRFWERFADEWRLQDPPEVARILANDCPAAVRDKLLNDWAPPQGTFSDFSFHPPDPATYVTVEWFKQVRGALDPSLVPEAIRDNECKPWWLELLPVAKPEPASLDETIKSNLTDGASKPKAIGDAMSRMVEQAIQQTPGLAEPYLTGGATRRDLLDQLCQAIPGADAYPQALEQAAWRATAGRSDPRQLMEWAAELSKQDGFNGLFREAVVPDYGGNADPRGSHLLERLQIIVAAVTDTKTEADIRWRQQRTWENWRELAPRPALAWRDALHPDDPLRAKLTDPKKKPSD